MNSNKGITLMALIIYIAVILVALAILATLIFNFRNNINSFNQKGTSSYEIDKFNMYFLQEVKKTGNKVDKISNNEILFTTGNKYTFKNDNAIYLNDNIKIAEEIETCKFSNSVVDGKDIITVVIKALDVDERTIEYALSDESSIANYEDENNYVTQGMPLYANAKRRSDGSNILTENALWQDNGGTAVIPKGFKVVNGIDGKQEVAEGLVIEDEEGNQFVWIPVKYTPSGLVDSHGLDSGFLNVFYRSNWANNVRTTGLDAKYTGPYVNGYEGIEEEYYAMMKSVQDNEGFYIGRYEAGSTEPRISTSKDTTMVVKRDQYPYIYVGWGNSINNLEDEVVFDDKNHGHGAVYLSKHFYDKKDVGVVSTLCYGVEWDTMLEFIKDDTHNVTNSTNWGNYKDNAWTITRSQAKYSENGVTWQNVNNSEKHKDNNTSIFLTTGASDSFAAKNIYDIAGNCHEWTMECYDTDDPVLRSGHWRSNTTGVQAPASCRDNWSDPNYVDAARSFRPALYIKN